MAKIFEIREAREEGRASLTVFGSFVARIMVRRGMKTWASLIKTLAEHEGGAKFKRGAVHNWVHGKTAVSVAFPKTIERVMNLTRREREGLALAYTFGCTKDASEENERRVLGELAEIA